MTDPDHHAVPGADFLALSELRSIQERFWRRQAAYVRTTSEFYKVMTGMPTLRGTLDELADVPFTDKQMLRGDQRVNPPFGSYLAAEPHRIMRMHRTSGTTGSAMNLALSRRDAGLTAVVGSRAQAAAGLGPGHRVVHCGDGGPSEAHHRRPGDPSLVDESRD